MNTLKPNSFSLSVMLLLLLTFISESCTKKDMLTSNENAEIAGRAANKGNALPHTKQFTAEVANDWVTLLTDITKAKPYISPQALRLFAYSGVALYESVVPGMPSYQSIYTYLTGNSIEVGHKKDYYWPASANAAMARISSRIMQDYPAPDLAAVHALEASFNTKFQAKVTPEQLQFSNEFGQYVADKIYEWSKTDGTFNPDGSPALCPPYVLFGGPGNWIPTPPFYFPAAGACQGTLRTFIPGIVNTAMAPPPPVYSTDPASAFYQAANEVYQSRNAITTQETNSFNNWRDALPMYNPLAHMLRISTDIFKKENLDLEEASVIYAKLTMAAFDAICASFNSKFHYSLIRPVTYIQDVMGHTSWNSLPITPQTPSYPDESSATASSIAILESYFGTNYAFVDDIHKSLYGEQPYSSFNEMMLDVVQSRVNGGTIFRFSGEAGITQGRTVGTMINQLPFKKE